ncbi:MAG TPA: type I methionyl aminopeptidase [Patescibacteria group bacterium]|nr:type I methionyl aminopeptidase [Patescibacteria group bacterium]
MAMIKKTNEINILREGGQILAQAVAHVIHHIVPGITTDELDQLFTEYVRGHNAEPSFLGFHGYPKSICTSINDEVVHAIPGNRKLISGDILGIDCGVRYKEYCTDMARTVAIGTVSAEAKDLMRVTKKALQLGIDQAIPGHTIGDIGAAIQRYVERHGYSVVRVLVGHGVGADVHEEPQIPNFGKAGSGRKLEKGMVLALEPMVNVGESDVVFDQNGWTVRTADGTLSAHFEETIVITEGAPELLTR